MCGQRLPGPDLAHDSQNTVGAVQWHWQLQMHSCSIPAQAVSPATDGHNSMMQWVFVVL